MGHHFPESNQFINPSIKSPGKGRRGEERRGEERNKERKGNPHLYYI